jgi:hypothetical protein
VIVYDVRICQNLSVSLMAESVYGSVYDPFLQQRFKEGEPALAIIERTEEVKNFLMLYPVHILGPFGLCVCV